MNRVLKVSIPVFACIAFFGITWILYPTFRSLPMPSGIHAVGVASYHLVDTQREDKRMPSGKREFRVNIFYPSDQYHKEQQFPYRPDHMEGFKKIKARYPMFSTVSPLRWNTMLSTIKSYAAPNASISSKESPYPVIIFLPGIGGQNLYNVHLEELASQGYIVVELEPPFDVAVTVFPNGYTVELDDDLRYAMEHVLRNEIYAYRTEAHKRWAKDVEYLLSYLREAHNDSSSFLYHRLDLDAIGICGHSHGGAVVTEFCATHQEIKAGVNMDGWTKNVNTTQGFMTPFMFLLNTTTGYPDEIDELFKNMGPQAQKIEIADADHSDFGDSMVVILPCIKYLGAAQPADSVQETINHHLVSFFDSHLKQCW